MLVITVTTKGSTSEHALDQEAVTIGSGPACDVIVPKAAKLHATIQIDRNDRLIIVDHSFWGTKLDGRRIHDKAEIGEGTIAIARSTLRVLRVAPPDLAIERFDLVEQQLVRAVARGDEASRLVYADWLEQRGDHERARFLRLQAEIAGMKPDSIFLLAAHELRTLAAGLDPAWRRAVAQVAVEGCVGFELQCPKQWSSLESTERSDVRFCGACQQQVFYCTTIESARRRAQRNECVAIDIKLERSYHDLEPVIRMGKMVAGGRPQE